MITNHFFNRAIKSLIVVSAISGLIACGGSGGGGGGQDSVSTPSGGSGGTGPEIPPVTVEPAGWSTVRTAYSISDGSKISSLNLVAGDSSSIFASWLESSDSGSRILSGKVLANGDISDITTVRSGLTPVVHDWNYSWSNYNTVASVAAPGNQHGVTAWIEQTADHVYQICFVVGGEANPIASSNVKVLYKQSNVYTGFQSLRVVAAGTHAYVLFFSSENSGELILSDIDTATGEFSNHVVSSTASAPSDSGSYALQPLFVTTGANPGILWAEDAVGSYQITYATVADIENGQPGDPVGAPVARYGEMSALTTDGGITHVYWIMSTSAGARLAHASFDPGSSSWSAIDEIQPDTALQYFSVAPIQVGSDISLLVGVSDSDATLPQRDLKRINIVGDQYEIDSGFSISAVGTSPVSFSDTAGNSIVVFFGNATTAISLAADGETLTQTLGGNYASVRGHATVIADDGHGVVIGAKSTSTGAEIVQLSTQF